MKGYYRHILLASAALLAAASCTKTRVEEIPSEPMPISISAVDGAATKALLDNGTFNKTGNRIQVYDYVDGVYYFDDLIGPDVPGNNYGFEGVWPFVAGPHQWTPGTHKFFGWLAEDANMTSATDAAANTPEEFFGSGFNFYGDDETETEADKKYTLTIPAKEMTADTPQFDFLYSNIITTEPQVEPVALTFSHLFSAFYITALNRDDAGKVTIKNITISGLNGNKSATVDFSGEQTAVKYIDSGAAGTSFSFGFTDVEGVLSTESKKLTDTYMIWPQTTDDFADAKLDIKYDYTVENQTNEQNRSLPLSSITAWEAGKVNAINITFDVEQITFYIRTLEEWNTTEQDIVVEM